MSDPTGMGLGRLNGHFQVHLGSYVNCLFLSWRDDFVIFKNGVCYRTSVPP